MTAVASQPTLPLPPGQIADPARIMRPWRTRLLNGLLIGLSICGLPGVVVGIAGDFATGTEGAAITALLFSGAYASIVAATILRQLGFVLRALVLATACYAVGVIALISSGLSGSGRDLLLLFTIVTATLFGLRGGVIAVAISFATMAICGGLIVAGQLTAASPTVAWSTHPADWISAVVLMLLAQVAAVISSTYMAGQAARFAATAEENMQHVKASNAATADQARELAAQTERLTATEQALRSLVATLETPVVALAQGVVLAPLVGTIDSTRADMLTTRLLAAAEHDRPRLVIIDIAGVKSADSQVVAALLQTARALRMIGCEVALTGITAPVAMTLSSEGLQLAGLRVARSPQEILADRSLVPSS